ncbi:hypothetical protein FRC03_000900 [Tulasnella sp. 419]|nr:hypothetical protein FRC03_000900 [Tulasnella sp. 419]
MKHGSPLPLFDVSSRTLINKVPAVFSSLSSNTSVSWMRQFTFSLVTFHLYSFVLFELYLVNATQNRTYSYDKIKRSIPVPNRYIVRFSKNNNPQIIDRFYVDLESRGIHAEPRFRIISDTFTATSFDLPIGVDISIISKIQDVENQWPVKSVPLNGKNDGPNPFSSLVKKWDAFKENTGVAKLHGLGIKGDGVTVAIIDTGINFKHPALGNAIGPDKKVRAEYDFQGPEIVETRPDDENKDCDGHGTNVAGVLAAEDSEFGLLGVAPNVNVLSYKVAACGEESSETDRIIAAIDHASKQDVDIIQLAHGKPHGWADNAIASAVSAYVERGIFISVSGGNDGLSGVFNADEGASGTNAMAVGAIAEIRYSLWKVEVEFGGNKKSIPVHLHLTANFPEPPEDKELVATSRHTTFDHDACVPVKMKNLRNYLVLVRRSSRCNFEAQLEHLGVKGATTVLFDNNHQPYAVPDVESRDDIQYGMITAEAGTWLAENLKRERSSELSFLRGKTPLPEVRLIY